MKKKSVILNPFNLSILTAEILLGILLSFTSLTLYTKLMQKALSNQLSTFDSNVWNFVFSLRSPILNIIISTISYFGGTILIVGSVLSAFFLWDKKMKHEAIFFPFVVLMSTVINNILKILIKRPRPDIAPLLTMSDYSFPSGHAMNSFVFFATLTYLYYHHGKNKKNGLLVTSASIFIILIIGISRVYLGVHYASDVLAGYITGLCWFATAIVINKTIIMIKKNINE